MAYTVSKVEMWTAEINDRVGGLDAKLAPLADAGVDLEIVIARRQPHLPGRGVAFLGPIKGAKGQKAAAAAGLTRAASLYALRVEGPNKAGDCRRVTRLLADAGISLRGLSATVCGSRYVLSLGFDTEADAARAASLLKGSKRK
jgi:hypothetical protein